MGKGEERRWSVGVEKGQNGLAFAAESGTQKKTKENE
jgi:hypothetical protein